MVTTFAGDHDLLSQKLTPRERALVEAARREAWDRAVAWLIDKQRQVELNPLAGQLERIMSVDGPAEKLVDLVTQSKGRIAAYQHAAAQLRGWSIAAAARELEGVDHG